MPHRVFRCGRWTLLALSLAALPRAIAAQDTTQVRADTARARADSAAQRPDSARAPRQAPQVEVPRIRVPPPLPPPWKFQVDIGLQDVAGNRELRVYNGAFTVERRRQDRFLLNTKLEARYGRSNGTTSVNAQALKVRFDWAPRDPVSPFLGLDVGRDPIRKMALRTQVGTGLNFNVSVRDDKRTVLSLGFVGDFQRYTEGTTPAYAEDTRLHLRAATTQLFGQVVRFDASVKMQPALQDFADYLATVDIQFRLTLTRRTGLLARYEYWRDSRPATGVQPSDRAFNLNLSFTW